MPESSRGPLTIACVQCGSRNLSRHSEVLCAACFTALDKRRSGGLVSSLYGRAPSEGDVSREEAAKRLQRSINRLIAEYGGKEVRRRIRAYASEDESAKARLVLLALTEDSFSERSPAHE